jgi:signal transduction histidine kinase
MTGMTETPQPTADGSSVSQAQLEAITAVSSAVAQSTSLRETLDRIARTAKELLQGQAAAVVLPRGEVGAGLSVAGSHGLSQEYTDFLNDTHALDDLPTGLALKQGEPAIVEDFLLDPLTAPLRHLALREHFRAIVCMPLRLAEGRTIGVLNAYRAEPGPWDERQVALLSVLADHAAIAIRTADLLDRTRRQVDGLSLMVRSLRAQAHEHSNRLHAIYGLLVLGETTQAQQLIAHVEAGYHSMYGTVTKRIENATIAGFLVAEATIARESGIELKLDGRSRIRELPPGLVDLDAITVIGNLVHNAVEAVSTMPPPRRRVSIALLEKPDETIFRVRDWGPGLADGADRRLFDREFTTKNGHAGIGLSLVRNVVDRVGGQIDVLRPRTGGLSVAVSFPR